MTERFSLKGRVVLITGAATGLGQHFAEVLASAGARVAVAARRADKLAATVEHIRASGGEAVALTLDVTQSSSVKACLDALNAEWGAPDVVINNAGVTVTRSLLEQTEEDWDQIMATNLKGAWLVATEAARRMVAADKGGAIVNVASILGERVAGGVAPYAISKAGVVQATKAMALELARHPLADFAYHCMSWHIPASLWRGIAGLELAGTGIPSEQAYVDAYATATGRQPAEHWDFYMAYNLFRMAAILRGIGQRAADGTAAAEDAVETAAKADPLAEIGWACAKRYSGVADGRQLQI